MLGQLHEGVAEESRETDSKEKRSEGGVKGFVSHYQNWGSEAYISKSLGDTLFPSLEETLESEGLLADVSDQMSEVDYWSSGEMERDYPPGSLIRVTASGSLFDARYVASIFSSFGAAALGFQGLGTETPAPPTPPIKRQQRPPRPNSGAQQRAQLEDAIPDFTYYEGNDPAIDAKQLRSLLRVARGLFTPGLHLNLFPIGGDEVSIGARLQEGQQYLDSDPEILFARYGTGEQDWTLVGSIGHYGSANNASTLATPQLLSPEQRVLRARTAKFINNFMGLVGSHGFSDLPQSPGFSMVPLAVYRANPRLSFTPTVLGDD